MRSRTSGMRGCAFHRCYERAAIAGWTTTPGRASAALWTSGLALIATNYIENRVEMLGYAFTAGTFGSVFGPIAGGLLLHAGGYRLPFLLTGALFVLNAVGIALILPAKRPTYSEALDVRALLLDKSVVIPALAVALAAFSVGIVEPLLPVRLARYGTTSTAVGLVFTISTLVYGLSAPVVGWVSERWPTQKVMVLGTIAMAATLPLLAVFKGAVGGVGVTPMSAITEHIVEEGKRTGVYRPIHFIHGTQNSTSHAFGTHIRALAAQHPALTVHVCYSEPGAGDKTGITHDSDGRINIELVKTLLRFGDYDFYLCGPSQFMNDLYSGLIGIGVRPERIHYESFGPGTVLKPELPRKPADERRTGSVRVKFAKSDVEAIWSVADGTLLEFAEEAGLAPAFGCRSGICGTCRTRIVRGAVEYVEEPLADRHQDEILICCSVPKRTGDHSYNEGTDVILDL